MKPFFIYGTEAQILQLSPGDSQWKELAFYYPSDKHYFYQIQNGVMKKFGDGSDDAFFGYGVLINGKVMGGVKTKIVSEDELYIPENYDYNTYSLDVKGVVNCEGQINIF